MWLICPEIKQTQYSSVYLVTHITELLNREGGGVGAEGSRNMGGLWEGRKKEVIVGEKEKYLKREKPRDRACGGKTRREENSHFHKDYQLLQATGKLIIF